MSEELKPWHDCPPCPSCGTKVGCPARHEERGRWSGPDTANLFCPACGVGWVGSGPEVLQAELAREIWDRKCRVESGEARLLDAVDKCLRIISDPEMHNAGKGQAISALGLFLQDGLKRARGER